MGDDKRIEIVDLKKLEEKKQEALKQMPPKKLPFVTCLFGDGIAYGLSDKEKGGWATRLRFWVEKTHPSSLFYNFAIQGETSEKLTKRFDKETEDIDPSLIIFALGMNDSSFIPEKASHEVPLDKFKLNISDLIFKSKQQTKQILYVGLAPVDETKTSPVHWNKKRHYKNRYIQKYNEELMKLCRIEQVAYLNIYDDLKRIGYTSGMLADGLHPNTQGHEWIFNQVKGALRL